MTADWIEVGEEVSESPMGAGVITDITDAGYPRVNHVAVAWVKCADGRIFNPHNVPIPAREAS